MNDTSVGQKQLINTMHRSDNYRTREATYELILTIFSIDNMDVIIILIVTLKKTARQKRELRNFMDRLIYDKKSKKNT